MHDTAATRKFSNAGRWFYIERKRLCAHYFSGFHVVNLHAAAATRVCHSPRRFFILSCFYESSSVQLENCARHCSHTQLQHLST